MLFTMVVTTHSFSLVVVLVWVVVGFQFIQLEKKWAQFTKVCTF